MSFAKIIDLKNDDQVLLVIRYNYDDDNYELSFETEFEDVICTVKAGFKEREKAVKAMDGYTKEDAIKFRKQMEKIIS